MTPKTSIPKTSTPKTSTPKTSRDLPATPPRKDEERDTQNAVIEDADKTEGKVLIHGDGGTIDLPVKQIFPLKPGGLSKDD
jgi:hypothetical protein